MTKEERILLNKVLNKGQLFINLPVTLIMAFFMGISIYLNAIGRISTLEMLFAALISFILAWLFWSIFIVKWRLWAFDQIDENFHFILKQEATHSKLIWPDGHFLGKTEIQTKEQKLKVKAINTRITEIIRAEDD